MLTARSFRSAGCARSYRTLKCETNNASTGGQTTISGINYQALITALYLGRLVDPRQRGKDETAVEVRPEASAEAEVDDIVVRFADGHTVWIRVKESLEGSTTWARPTNSATADVLATVRCGERHVLELSQITKPH